MKIRLRKGKISFSMDKLNISNILLFAVYFFSCITGIINYQVTSIIVCILLVILFKYPEYYLAFPVILLYYSILVLPGINLSIFVIYLLLMGVRLVREGKILNNIDMRNIGAFLVIFIYSCTFFLVYSIKLAIPFLICSLIIFLYVKRYLNRNSDSINLFFKYYVIGCLCSYLTGIFTDNVMIYDSLTVGKVLTLKRWMATFNDPNYMGIFFMIAIFAILCLELYSWKVRLTITAILLIMLLSTMSMTAILGLVMIYLVYLLLKNKISIKLLSYLIIVFCILIGIYNYGLNNPSTPLLGTVTLRVQERIDLVSKGSLSKASTGRTDLSKEHLKYFASQDVINQLIGGNIVNSIAIEKKIGNDYAVAHNEYVDLLLNVGILGTILILLSWLIVAIKDLFNYLKYKKKYDLCSFILKSVFLYYCFGLTMFMDIRFYIFYIL